MLKKSGCPSSKFFCQIKSGLAPLFVFFLVLPGRVAAATKSAATEFTRACNAAVAAAIVARRQ